MPPKKWTPKDNPEPSEIFAAFEKFGDMLPRIEWGLKCVDDLEKVANKKDSKHAKEEAGKARNALFRFYSTYWESFIRDVDKLSKHVRRLRPKGKEWRHFRETPAAFFETEAVSDDLTLLFRWAEEVAKKIKDVKRAFLDALEDVNNAGFFQEESAALLDEMDLRAQATIQSVKIAYKRGFKPILFALNELEKAFQ